MSLKSLKIAFRAFMKAWKNPKKGQEFVQDKPKEIEQSDPSHLRLLALLQNSGRLIDFLKEDIKDYDDNQIGAAVRKIHEDCAKTIEDLVTIRPVLEESEGSAINVPQGYDSASMKLVGKVKGEPPYKGILVHKGWKAHKKSLPKQVGAVKSEIIFPAEVEIR